MAQPPPLPRPAGAAAAHASRTAGAAGCQTAGLQAPPCCLAWQPAGGGPEGQGECARRLAESAVAAVAERALPAPLEVAPACWPARAQAPLRLLLPLLPAPTLLLHWRAEGQRCPAACWQPACGGADGLPLPPSAPPKKGCPRLASRCLVECTCAVQPVEQQGTAARWGYTPAGEALASRWLQLAWRRVELSSRSTTKLKGAERQAIREPLPSRCIATAARRAARNSFYSRPICKDSSRLNSTVAGAPGGTSALECPCSGLRCGERSSLRLPLGCLLGRWGICVSRMRCRRRTCQTCRRRRRHCPSTCRRLGSAASTQPQIIACSPPRSACSRYGATQETTDGGQGSRRGASQGEAAAPAAAAAAAASAAGRTGSAGTCCAAARPSRRHPTKHRASSGL